MFVSVLLFVWVYLRKRVFGAFFVRFPLNVRSVTVRVSTASHR